MSRVKRFQVTFFYFNRGILLFFFIVRTQFLCPLDVIFMPPARSILYRRIRRLNPFRRWKGCINYETCHEYSIFGNPSSLFSIIPFLSLIPRSISSSPRHDPLYLSRAAIKIVLKARESLSIEAPEGKRELLWITVSYRNIETLRFVLRFAPPAKIFEVLRTFSSIREKMWPATMFSLPIVEVILSNSFSLLSILPVTTWIVDVWQLISELERNRRHDLSCTCN